MRQRVAAVDCGTNSIRLLIADIDPERNVLTDVAREMRIVRLGEGVDRTGRLSQAALGRTIGALREYAELIGRVSPAAVRMVATSATRDAENAQEFVDQVKEVLGVTPEVVSGDEEARLSFTGATRELADTPAPYLVTDIGGGSTEFVLGGPGGVSGGRSVDIGCVRMTERHLHGDPPAHAEIAAATADIDSALDLVAAAVPAWQARTLVGLAGSVTTVAGIALGLERGGGPRARVRRGVAGGADRAAVGVPGVPAPRRLAGRGRGAAPQVLRRRAVLGAPDRRLGGSRAVGAHRRAGAGGARRQQDRADLHR